MVAAFFTGGVYIIFFLVQLLFYIYQPDVYYDDNSDMQQNYSEYNSDPIVLCVLVRIYGPQVPYLPVLALGFLNSGFDRVRMYVINTDNGTDGIQLRQTIGLINKIAKRIDYVTILELNVSMKNDFGYALTDRALLYFYNQYEKDKSTCEYVIVTNGDNLYSRYLGTKILPYMKAKMDIIAWDFVSRYPRYHLTKALYKTRPLNFRVSDDGTAKCIRVSLKLGEVDLGAVAYRLNFLHRHRLLFAYPNGSYSAVSDGYFTENASRLTNASVLVRQTLFIHQ